jgi:uncharacterized membrane protein
MRRYVIAYLATLVALCLADFLWLGVVAAGFYRDALGALLRTEPRWDAALAFYLLYVVGIVVFCVRPALDAGAPRRAVGLGALLGLVAYGTYDLSNLATLQGWPAIVTVVDIAWGALVTAVAAFAGALAACAARR